MALMVYLASAQDFFFGGFEIIADKIQNVGLRGGGGLTKSKGSQPEPEAPEHQPMGLFLRSLKTTPMDFYGLFESDFSSIRFLRPGSLGESLGSPQGPKQVKLVPDMLYLFCPWPLFREI